jgi:glucose/arabinose dehydrogenase
VPRALGRSELIARRPRIRSPRSLQRSLLGVVAAVLVATSWIPVATPGPVAAADPPTPRFLGPKAVGATPGRGPRVLGVTKPGFQDTIAISGLTAPTAVRFSPDGRVFVAEKGGRIRVYPSLTATTPTDFVGLQTNVVNFWDRGLMGLALDPGFPANPYVYVLYTLDAAPGSTPPRWNDSCPSPPGPTTDGCLVGGRLSRFTVSGTSAFGSEQVLIEGWCQQYPSHTTDDLRFGADGALYVSAGDGASFTMQDYGQGGGGSAITPRNPCGDPPGGVGGAMTAPTARGGRLRAQSLRRPAGEPVTLNGTLLRVDPATGDALLSNPLAAHADANARRIVGYGMRNPYRFTIRPGTNELWIGDGGDLQWEEIDRIVDPLAPTVANLGWPCYEGAGQHAQYKAQNLDMCNSLYAAPSGVIAPYFTYNHDVKVVPGETCATGSSVISGISFYSGSSYPAVYKDALVFADYSRDCIWAMKVGSNGLPDPTKIETFVAAAAGPVAVEAGPGGDIFYVDYDGGAIHRIRYTAGNQAPSAVIVATPSTGSAPLTVAFDGTGSSDPEGGALVYAWDLDGDGAYDDSTASKPPFTYPTDGNYSVGLKVTDVQNLSTTTATTIIVHASLPDPVIDTPAATLAWAVGDRIDFAGHATDNTGAALAASALTWTLILHHCPSNCHAHTIQSWQGVAGGFFNAPDHDYPSYLELVLTATDGQGGSATTSVRLDPRTVVLSFASSPPGLGLAVGVDPPVPAPFTKSFIVNSTVSLAAPSPQVIGATTYTFNSWSDGGLASHSVVASAAATTYTATFNSSGPTTSYLSDLAYTVVANGYGPAEKDRSNAELAAGDGKPLTLAGIVYAKGIGVHAASDIRYGLTDCTTFTAKVGLDDEVGTNGSLSFQIWGDAVKLADSGIMTGASPTQTLTVDLSGRSQLKLVVDPNGVTYYDHADWADARLTCGSGAPPPPPPGPFQPKVDYTVGTSPHSVVARDVNGDGRPDLVVANAYGNSVGVLLAKADGTFAPATSYPTGLRPKFVAVADFNGDGKQDVVTANQDANTVSVLLGSGTGTFGAPVSQATCIGPHEVASGDFDKDGKQDIAVACHNGAVVTTHRGNGDGTLAAGVNLATGSSPHSLVMLDLNGDTNLDIAVANRNANAVGILLGNGAGAFAASVSYPVGTNPHSLRAGDINGDGKLDLVTANDGANSVSVLLGTGTGTFGAAINTAVGLVPKGVAVADLNLDGKLDVITANTAGNGDGVSGIPGGDNVSVLLGAGNGTFSAATSVVVGPTPFSVAAADLDGNGSPDLATANWHGNSVSVLRNTLAGPPPTDTTPPTITAIGPADGATSVASGVNATASFSEAIDPATISGTTMSLVVQGTTTPLAASVTYDPTSRTATLDPSASLAASTTYVATVRGGPTGVKDTAGNSLAADRTWSFTTAAAGGTPTTAYLSDLAYTVTANGYGPAEKDRSNGELAAGDGKPLTLAGIVYAKGIGAHAASDIGYPLAAACSTFVVKVGLDDEVGANGSLSFQIWGDTTKLADSGIMTGASPTQTLTVDLTGRSQLRLVVDPNGVTYHDHADWADARLTCTA